MASIIVIDDDKDLLRIIKNALESQGHIITCYSNAKDVDTMILNDYQLMILDVMMPELDGFDFCQRVRKKVDYPILFITSKTRDQDLVKGLSIGGDDYIKKPFSILELRARVEVHLRRIRKDIDKVFTVGNCTFHMETKEVFIKDKKVNMTKSEYEISEFLALNCGHNYSKSQIFERVFGFDKDTFDSVIVEHIKNIRRKLLQFEEMPIDTVWGIGYRWKK